MNTPCRCLLACLAVALTFAWAPGAEQAHAQSVIDEWATVKAPPPPALKDVTVDAAKTALMVLDFRKGRCAPTDRIRCARAIPKVVKLLGQARAKGMFIVHTTTSSGSPADIPDELTPAPGEQVLSTSMDKLNGSGLPEQFKAKGIDTIIIVGTSANGAVLNTATGAVMRGFKIIIPVDAIPANGAYEEQFVVYQMAHGSGLRQKSTLTSTDRIRF